MVRTKHSEGVEIDLDPLVKVFGMEALIQMLGPKHILDTWGPQRMIDELGPDWFLSRLTNEQRRELKRRLK